jgi:hypothetical protein
MAYIFLSYAKSDRDSAFVIRDLLEEAGLTVWMDKNKHELQRQHWSYIQENLRNAAALIVLVSEPAQDSAWVKAELDFAETIQKSIFPLLIQGTGWSRFGTEIGQLKPGLTPTLPSELLLQLQEKIQNAPKARLPQQIYINPLEEQWARRKKVLLILGLNLLLWIAIWLFLPPTINRFSPDFKQTQRAESTLNSLQGTSAASIASRQTQNADNRATQIQHYADATSTYDANMSLTAAAGNGFLPCTASPIIEERAEYFTLYLEPIRSDIFNEVSRDAEDVQTLILTEWIVNEYGSWYQVYSINGVNYNYSRAESLILDANCPR